MAAKEVNYFGSDPVVPDDDALTSQESFENSDEEQLNFGREYTEAARAIDRMPEEFTTATLPRNAWVEIDLSAIEYNLKCAREAIGNNKLLMAVVKADAYGHGAVRVAQRVLQAGADRLAVATVEEGVELREAGIDASILVLSEPPISAIPYVLSYDLVVTVCTVEFALALGEAADAQGKVAPFHLAVDSGMNRIGVFYLDVVEFIQAISFHRGLKYEGTFTHFATADLPSDWDFRIQVDRFEKALSLLKDAGINPGIVHAANSAAIFRYPQVHYDMCRLGVALYGLSPNPDLDVFPELKPALSLKARISFIKEPQMGEGVSYGMTYRVASPVQIATIPIGYADGLRRELSNKIEVLCNGRPCRQVGTICMDQMMIEIPQGHSLYGEEGGAQVGDEVVIIGRQGSYETTAASMAAHLNTVAHEVVCLLALRLPRIYV